MASNKFDVVIVLFFVVLILIVVLVFLPLFIIVFEFVVFLFVVLVHVIFPVEVIVILLFVPVILVIIQVDTFDCSAEGFPAGIFGLADRVVEGARGVQTQGEEGWIAVDGLGVGRHEDVSCSEYVLGIDAAGKKR
jgi:hypothetical protein